MSSTQAEKLQKLIELAWGNGYAGNKIDRREHQKKDTEDLMGVLLAGSIEQTAASVVIEGDLENIIIFDHKFIKALCKAKYGEQVDNPRDSKTNITIENPFHERNDLAWHAVITWVAIARNRIDYLYGEFCE